MRFAWTLPPAPDEAVAEAVAAEELGFDAVWIEAGGAAPPPVEPAAMAARLAEPTIGVRIGVTAAVGVEHPVELAEQMAVADLAVGGRLVLAVRPVPGSGERLAEVLDLLLDSLASHPFRHQGPAWPTPANLAQNVFNVEQRVRVTPPPAQFEMPLWVAGRIGRDAAVERALGVLADADEQVDDLASWSADARRTHPFLARRIRRAMRWLPPDGEGSLDVEAAVTGLRIAQRAVDLDLVVVDHRGVTGDRVDDPGLRQAMMEAMARGVRPRLQLDRYPPGLEDHWVGESEPGAQDTVHQATRQESRGISHG